MVNMKIDSFVEGQVFGEGHNQFVLEKKQIT